MSYNEQFCDLATSLTGIAFGDLVNDPDSVRSTIVTHITNRGSLVVAPRYIVRFFELLKLSKHALTRAEVDLAMRAAANWIRFMLCWFNVVYYDHLLKLMAHVLGCECVDDLKFVQGQFSDKKIFPYVRNIVFGNLYEHHNEFVSNVCKISLTEYQRFVSVMYGIILDGNDIDRLSVDPTIDCIRTIAARSIDFLCRSARVCR